MSVVKFSLIKYILIIALVFLTLTAKAQLCPELNELQNKSLVYGFKDTDGRRAVFSLLSMSLDVGFMAVFDLVIEPNDDGLGMEGHLFYKITDFNQVECWLKFPTLEIEYKVLECEFLYEEKVKITMFDYSGNGGEITSIYLPRGSDNITNDFDKSLRTGTMYK